MTADVLQADAHAVARMSPVRKDRVEQHAPGKAAVVCNHIVDPKGQVAYAGVNPPVPDGGAPAILIFFNDFSVLDYMPVGA